jgi:PAS domain-containing protein
MPAAHCVSTVEGIILQADQGFFDLLQREEYEVIGISYRQITDPRDLRRSAEMLALLEDGAAPVRLQKRYLRPDGSSIAANLLILLQIPIADVGHGRPSAHGIARLDRVVARATSTSRFCTSIRACSTVSTPHRASVDRRPKSQKVGTVTILPADPDKRWRI